MKKALGTVLAAFLALSCGCGTRAASKEWRIPFLDCLTGPIASIGEYLAWGAEYAASEINKSGGIAGKPVKIVPIDTGLDPQKGSVEMAKIVKDALVALGPVPEPVIMAAMPIAVENRMMSFTATTSLEYADKYFPWSISWFPSTEATLPVLVAGWASQFPDMKRAIQFVEPYGPWPQMAKAHDAGLSGLGIEVLPDIEVPSDAVSLSPLVVKALAEKPDGIVFSCNPEKIAKIIKELRARGWKRMDHLLIFGSGDAPELYAVGGSDLDGAEIYNYINPNLDSPRWNAFKRAYMKDHEGELPPSLSSNYYDAVYMIKEAIEKTGVTGDPGKLREERKKIADYCANVKGFKGVMFTWDMKNDVPTNKPAYIFKVEGGKKVFVKEVRP
jgi:branched-chain amino acid transport system substrate-binding protein